MSPELCFHLVPLSSAEQFFHLFNVSKKTTLGGVDLNFNQDIVQVQNKGKWLALNQSVSKPATNNNQVLGFKINSIIQGPASKLLR